MTAPQAIQAYVGGSQASVARLLGEAQQSWHRYLRGGQTPSAAKLESWANALDITLTYTADGWTVASTQEQK